MNSKMRTNSQLSTVEPKKTKQTNKQKNKNKLSKQLEQEQNLRNAKSFLSLDVKIHSFW